MPQIDEARVEEALSVEGYVLCGWTVIAEYADDDDHFLREAQSEGLEEWTRRGYHDLALDDEWWEEHGEDEEVG